MVNKKVCIVDGKKFYKTKQPGYYKTKGQLYYQQHRDAFVARGKIKVECSKCHKFVTKSYVKKHQLRPVCKSNALKWEIKHCIIALNRC